MPVSFDAMNSVIRSIDASSGKRGSNGSIASRR
jgi:hypothetical protein